MCGMSAQLGYHSSSLGGHEGMLQASQAIISHIFCSQPLIFLQHMSYIHD